MMSEISVTSVTRTGEIQKIEDAGLADDWVE